ncbi:serine/threonine-protein kinase mTOR-like [Varroa jacobsoni]|uniref:serine/threonine-protein kinase mTOR-like n=1 Tax=Varroa jacobsoni TaxID=62625 RepID=UPI000BF4BC2C|nr:serine/threonine-protein kinase mTOR-like [Varroa jacobsoni]
MKMSSGVAGDAMAARVAPFVERLKSRKDEVRLAAAKELTRLVNSEFRSLPQEEVSAFVSEFRDHIFKMVSHPENHQKRGAMQAIMALIQISDLATIAHYSSYIKTAQQSNDVDVIVQAAKALGMLVQSYTSNAAKPYYETQVQASFDTLMSLETDKDMPPSNVAPMSAVLVLKELATVNPTFFSKFLGRFFDTIFLPIEHPQTELRQNAVQALSAIFRIIVVREPRERQRLPYYDHCLDKVLAALADTSPQKDVGPTSKGLNRENLIHGNLLVLNELFRFSNLEWEQKMNKVEDIVSNSPVVWPKEKDPHNFNKFVLKYKKRPKQSRNMVTVTARPDITPTKESKICKSLLLERFENICSHVVRQMTQRNVHIHKALWELLPRLAAFAPEPFVNRKYLDRSLVYLQQCLKREKDRGNAFISVGMLALAVGDEHLGDPRPFVETIAEALQANAKYPGGGKKRQDRGVPEPAVFACISLLVRVKGPSIQQEIIALLPPILQAPLTAHVTGTLNEICLRIPSLKSEVQRGLLDVISRIIMKRPLTHPGDPMRTQSPPESYTEPAVMVQALKTLGQFDFEDHSLLPFIKHIANYCLGSEHAEIRLEVVRTCCLILSPKLYHMRQAKQYSTTLMCTVQDVLSKLMSAGVTDRDAEVRRCVLESLTERFDEHLAQAEHLDALFLILNDEVFEIRELALIVIGRLSTRNPAYVMPHLRKVLVQILTELEYSGMSRNTEESAKMLAHLLSSAPKLVKPYMQPVLSVLLPKITNQTQNLQTVGVTVAVMSAVGEQAEVSGPEMSQYLEELMPIVLDMMQEHVSIEKRDMALWTLAQLVESTGFVVVPYERYPNLMGNLLHILETGQSQTVKREVLRALGLLGALDPFKHKLIIGAIESDVTGGVLSLSNDSGDSFGGVGAVGAVGTGASSHASELLVQHSNNLDEFFSAMTLMSLTKMLLDQQQDSCCCAIARSLGSLINEVGMRVVPYLPQLLPALLTVIPRKCSHKLEAKLGPIISMTEVVGKHISTFLDEILACTREVWVVNSPMDPGVMDLVQTLVRALGSDFKVYIPRLLPHALKALANDISQDRRVTDKLLDTLVVLGCTLEEYLHLLLPPLVRLFEQPADNEPLRKKAIMTVDKLADTLDVSQFGSMIIHGLIRVIDSPCSNDLKDEAVALMTMMVCQLRKKFRIFKETVDEAIKRNRGGLKRVDIYDSMCNKVLEESTLVDDDTGIIPHRQRELREKSKEKNPSVTHKQRVGEEFIVTLTAHFDKHVLTEDWLTWLDSVQLITLSQAPDRAVRWCGTVTTYISPIHRELFNTAFLSCWLELNKEQKQRVITALQEVLTIQAVPEVTHAILNLNEFIEHYDTLLSDVNLLARKAFESRAYAKALRYREQQFQKNKASEPEVLESLIMINNKLQQPEGAAGVLEYAKKLKGRLRVRGGWYEKLHDWEAALNEYRMARESEPEDPEPIFGQMRCLEVLAEWKQLHQLASEEWEKSSVETQAKMARMASAAAWGLQNWDDMRKYSSALPKTSLDFAFHQAVLAVHEQNYLEAYSNIDKARDLLETDLTALWKESYPRAYPAMVQVQMLAELEEVVQYKLVAELRDHIRQKWWNRLQGCQASVEDWQRILQVHSLATSPCDDQRTWLKFASLCRSSGRLQQSRRVLATLLGTNDPTPQNLLACAGSKPEVSFAFMKHMWTEARLAKDLEKKKTVLNLLHKFSHEELTKITEKESAVPPTQKRDYQRLLSKCFLKCGRWKEELDGVNEASLRDILYYLTLAKKHNSAWHKAWHAFAYINFEAILLHQRNKGQNADTSGFHTSDHTRGMTDKLMHDYAVPAVQGFIRSIALSDGSDGSSLQDTLRLLTLWFDYGHFKSVLNAVSEAKKAVPVMTWLQVIPQLIARIDTPNHNVANLILELLMDISKHHPQALIYPLTVAHKSNAAQRSHSANVVLSFMNDHWPNLVKQARLVSHELIRVSILWHELWHEGLEEASRLYFGERNVQGMLDTLKPLHDLMVRGPETLKETAFYQAYAADLVRANDCCQNYRRTHNVKELGTAWDQYYGVFRRISKQLPQLTNLELQHCSPKLLECTNLELAVPGSYNPTQPIVKIHSVHSTLQVIASKQRPRKLTVKGSDGRDFTFLLKGHEDLRQDERVMQLFGLVNTLLINDPETSRRNLTIQRYSVIPLSTNSGLIGWVPNCDTLHTLIKDHRERKKILLNIEHRIMLRMAPQYDHLPLMHKVEVFEYALEATQGQDLAQLLWLKSPTSEEWFERRTNYTRSLAVMSMVGYVLGLGDRHPSNLMLRTSGKILHIDFGDCFEVAMTREKFPEKIPFRLTRMLILAMEVTGIEGTYRITCEKVLKVLRNHKDSLMAVLEAFVYDPLFNWRLVEANAQPTGRNRHTAAPRPTDTTIARDPNVVVNNSNTTNNTNGSSAALEQTQQPTTTTLHVLSRVTQDQSADSSAGGDGATLEVAPTESLSEGRLTASEILSHPQSDGAAVFNRSSQAHAQSESQAIQQQQQQQQQEQQQQAGPSGAAGAAQQKPQSSQGPKQEVLNKKAVAIIKRVREKLTGRDFDQRMPLEVSQQVELLIRQATSPENLCQCYIGWCPFW